MSAVYVREPQGVIEWYPKTVACFIIKCGLSGIPRTADSVGMDEKQHNPYGEVNGAVEMFAHSSK